MEGRQGAVTTVNGCRMHCAFFAQEHVGEYGVHWNFFASVACVALLTHVVRPPPRLLPLLAATITCVHEVREMCGHMQHVNCKENRFGFSNDLCVDVCLLAATRHGSAARISSLRRVHARLEVLAGMCFVLTPCQSQLVHMLLINGGSIQAEALVLISDLSGQEACLLLY